MSKPLNQNQPHWAENSQHKENDQQPTEPKSKQEVWQDDISAVLKGTL